MKKHVKSRTRWAGYVERPEDDRLPERQAEETTGRRGGMRWEDSRWEDSRWEDGRWEDSLKQNLGRFGMDSNKWVAIREEKELTRKEKTLPRNVDSTPPHPTPPHTTPHHTTPHHTTPHHTTPHHTTPHHTTPHHTTPPHTTRDHRGK